jgi:hypothetical protein
MMDNESFVRDNAELVAVLPKDDPLRATLDAEIAAGRVEAPANVDQEAESLRDALRGGPEGRAPEPDDALERRLLSVPRASSSTPKSHLWLAVAALAAAAVVLFVVTRPAPVSIAPDSAGTARTPAAAAPASEIKPELIAVRLWNENCSSCKKLETKYKTVRAEHADDGRTLFVTFDFSTDKSTEQARMLAKGLGIMGVFEQHEGWSGTVLLVNPTTNAVIGKLRSAQTTDDMRRVLVAALDR